jgi:carbon monoxide dehydrogenase subunit G
MRLEGERDLSASAEEVRRGLRDPDVLRHVLPRCRDLAPVGPDHVVVAFAVQAGPLSDTFRGMVTILETTDGLQADLDAHGRTGRMTSSVRIRLEESLPALTRLRYVADVAVSGLMARASGAGIDVIGRRTVAAVLAALERVLVEQRQDARALV